MMLKQNSGLDKMSIADLVAQYRRAAEGTSNPNVEEANKSHDVMHVFYKQLRQTESGRAAITNLLDDPSPHVRIWAAGHSLAWAEDQAKAALIMLRDAKGSRAFDAEIALEEFKKGRLSFEY